MKETLLDIAAGIVFLFLATACFMVGFARLHDLIPAVPAAGYWDVFSVTVWFGIGVMFAKHWLFTSFDKPW